jgi:DNA-binding MarR family transcriptional regulator
MSKMNTEKQDSNRYILQMVENIYKLIGPAVPDEWLSSDLTITQFRLILVLQNYGPLRMSDIASKLKVTLPTTTIIVDNLVRKNLVLREANPQDRRLVICKLSPEGELLISKLWGSGQMIIQRLLESLTYEETQKAVEVADLLYQAALKLARTNQ